jgi:glycolate oxidase FAD binding subunit
VRDLVIGLSFVRADGARVRGGGKVVKNVAGFDLPKLMAGSLGTLGLITTVTFRLHPKPEASATVLFAGVDAPGARALMSAARAAQLELDAAAVLVGRTDGGDGVELGVRFEGFAPAVTEQCRRLVEIGAKLGHDGVAADGPGGARFWARHDGARAAPAELRAKVALLPADPAAADVFGRLRGALARARSVFYPTLGLGFVAGDVASAEAVAAAVAEARGRLAATGGTVVVEAAPASVRARLDVWGAPPSARDGHSSLPLMRAVKERLDPERRLAPGRFVGGI